jgi:hypothetical protein
VRKCKLRSLADCCVVAHSSHERFERLQVFGPSRRAEPRVEHLLPDGAFGAIDNRKDVVQIEVLPRPIVECSVRGGGAGAMIRTNGDHVPDALRGGTPLRAKCCQTRSALAAIQDEPKRQERRDPYSDPDDCQGHRQILVQNDTKG